MAAVTSWQTVFENQIRASVLGYIDQMPISELVSWTISHESDPSLSKNSFTMDRLETLFVSAIYKTTQRICQEHHKTLLENLEKQITLREGLTPGASPTANEIALLSKMELLTKWIANPALILPANLRIQQNSDNSHQAL